MIIIFGITKTGDRVFGCQDGLLEEFKKSTGITPILDTVIATEKGAFLFSDKDVSRKKLAVTQAIGGIGYVYHKEYDLLEGSKKEARNA